MFVPVDEEGRPVEAAGPAPFDGRTRAEAEREARATVAPFEPRWRMVALTAALERELRAIALHLGLVDDVLPPGARARGVRRRKGRNARRPERMRLGG